MFWSFYFAFNCDPQGKQEVLEVGGASFSGRLSSSHSKQKRVKLLTHLSS